MPASSSDTPKPVPDRRELTKPEAVDLNTRSSSVDGDRIVVHTFRMGGPVILGADADLETVLADLDAADPDAIAFGTSMVGPVVQFYVGDSQRLVSVTP